MSSRGTRAAAVVWWSAPITFLLVVAPVGVSSEGLLGLCLAAVAVHGALLWYEMRLASRGDGPAARPKRFLLELRRRPLRGVSWRSVGLFLAEGLLVGVVAGIIFRMAIAWLIPGQGTGA